MPVLIDQLLVDSQLAMASQLIPLEPEEAGAEFELEDPLDELEPLELLDDPPLLLELLERTTAAFLVPTVTIVGWAAVIGVRLASFLALCWPLVVTTW